MIEDIQFTAPATIQQEGIWFHAAGNSTAYWNLVTAKAFKGALDHEALVQALDGVLQRHSALRTNFRLTGDGLRQFVRTAVQPQDILQYDNYGEQPSKRISSIVRSEMERLQQRELDFAADVLCNLRVLQFGQVVVFIMAISHIITDGLSMQQFWDELSSLYNALTAAQRSPLPAQARQYVHYAAEQRQLLRSPHYQEQKAWWNKKLPAEIPVLELPFTAEKSNVALCSTEFDIPAALVQQIRSCSLRKRVLYSAVFLQAYCLLLHKYSGQYAFAIGNVVNGRKGTVRGMNDGVMGLFANRLIHIINVHDDQSLDALLQYIHTELMDGFGHQDVLLEDLAREYAVKMKSKGQPLYQAAFNMIKGTGKKRSFTGLQEFALLSAEEQVVTASTADYLFDICLYVLDKGPEVRIRLEWKSDEKLKPLAAWMPANYIHLLQCCVNQPQKTLGDTDWLLPQEKAFLQQVNDTSGTIGEQEVVHTLFRQRAADCPNRPALLCGSEHYTYTQLDEASDRLAASIAAQGLGRGSLVGIFLHRSAQLVTTMLAILKSGAAYLPLDPSYPALRIADTIADAQPDLVLTEPSLTAQLPASQKYFLLHQANDSPATGLPPHVHGGDLAYVIYTSGTTGRPKGVMIAHRSVVNFIQGICRLITFEGKRIYACTSPAFDIFVLESLLALSAGATVVLATEEEQQDPGKAVQAMRRHQTDMLQCTPARLKMLLDAAGMEWMHILSDLMIGGEAFPADLLQQLQSGFRGKIFNMYGPTETTVWSAVQDLTEADGVTIGSPILNTQIYITDKNNRIVGPGIFGELCIGGEGVACGYYRNDALTTEKFITLPAAAQQPVYRTGDIGRWLPDGRLQVGGRKDDQVKIRGYRVEPGDIECHLKRHPAIKDAVVVAKMISGSNELYAYYIADDAISAIQLRSHLRSVLPEYMIPAGFERLTTLPLTPARKTDRKALKDRPLPPAEFVMADDVAGRLHPTLVSLWKKQLHTEQPDAGDPFADFFQLGGHSLKALRLLNDIERTFQIKISIRDFFQSPTIFFLNEQLGATIPSLFPVQ